VISIAEMSRADLGAFVQEHLRSRGIDVVLSGGACVSIYSHDQYVSMDLDMIHTSLMKPKRKSFRDAMGELGFAEYGRYFKHPDTKLFVEFPAGPPAVGEEPVKEIQERHEATGVLRIISPTDCIKDRLTGFYHDNDHQCLAQAILVAQQNAIDIDEIGRWSKGEGKLDVFRQIREQLARKA
jgi:hypothetical protein